MKISILEPHLTINAGHYADWARKIAHYLAVELQHEVKVYAHKTVDTSIINELSEIAEVKPYFYSKMNLNTSYRNASPVTFLSQYNLISKELENIEESDLWIIPSLSSLFLLSLIRTKPKTTISTVIHLMPNFKGENDFEVWKLCGEELKNCDLNINFHVTVPELVPIYNNILQQPIQHVPYLYNNVDHKSIEQRTTLNQVGFLGFQRLEKGIQLIPQLTQAIKDIGLQIILQDTSGKIKLNNAKNISLIKYVENMSSVLVTCDLIILPFDPNRYRYRMSGIIIDALSHGIPVVVPNNTTSANLVKKFNAGETFDEFNVTSIFNAIKRVQTNYDAYAHGAYDACTYLHEHHGINNFINTLIREKH